MRLGVDNVNPFAPKAQYPFRAEGAIFNNERYNNFIFKMIESNERRTLETRCKLSGLNSIAKKNTENFEICDHRSSKSSKTCRKSNSWVREEIQKLLGG